VNNKLADIAVVVRARVHLITVLDKDRIPKGVPHRAILVDETLRVGISASFAVSVFVEIEICLPSGPAGVTSMISNVSSPNDPDSGRLLKN
jgi:hypothetical protein